jgi:hypothetical protein
MWGGNFTINTFTSEFRILADCIGIATNIGGKVHKGLQFTDVVYLVVTN